MKREFTRIGNVLLFSIPLVVAMQGEVVNTMSVAPWEITLGYLTQRPALKEVIYKKTVFHDSNGPRQTPEVQWGLGRWQTNAFLIRIEPDLSLLLTQPQPDHRGFCVARIGITNWDASHPYVQVSVKKQSPTLSTDVDPIFGMVEAGKELLETVLRFGLPRGRWDNLTITNGFYFLTTNDYGNVIKGRLLVRQDKALEGISYYHMTDERDVRLLRFDYQKFFSDMPWFPSLIRSVKPLAGGKEIPIWQIEVLHLQPAKKTALPIDLFIPQQALFIAKASNNFGLIEFTNNVFVVNTLRGKEIIPNLSRERYFSWKHAVSYLLIILLLLPPVLLILYRKRRNKLISPALDYPNHNTSVKHEKL